MSNPQIVGRDEWLAARKELLGREKEMTRARDALNADAARAAHGRGREGLRLRRARRTGRPARPVRRPPAAHRAALHVRSRVGGRLPELHRRGRRDLRRTARAPARPRHDARRRLAGAAREARAVPAEAGLDVPLVLLLRQRLQLRLPRDHRRVGRAGEYNYRTLDELEAGGLGWLRRGLVRAARLQLFLRDGDAVFHTYSMFARGTETLGGSYAFLDTDRARSPGGLGGAEGSCRSGRAARSRTSPRTDAPTVPPWTSGRC